MGMFFFVLLSSSVSFAAFSSKMSIPRLSQLESTDVYVFNDHRSKIRYRGSMLIQSREGETPKIRVLTYDKNDLELLSFKAWTMTGVERIEVPQTMIQTAPASEEGGFSNQVAVDVAFPRMKIGSVIHWEYEVKETHPPLHGFFSYLYRLDSDFHAAAGFRFRIDSEIPLITSESDPGENFQVNRKKHTYEVSLKRDVINAIVNEPNSYLKLERYPTVFVSTAPSWSKVGGSLLQLYEARLAEPLTPLVQKLVAEVKKKKDFNSRVRELSTLLNKNLRYLGDWRQRFSGQVPRTFAAISESQYGDCKDFSLIATRVLRELGYRAYLATVYMDRIPIPDRYYAIPINYFNHQIVYVYHKGKDHWIDPTTEDGLAVDDSLANRLALVWQSPPTPRRIPASKIEQNGLRYKLTLKSNGEQAFDGKLQVSAWGLEGKFSKQEEGSGFVRWVHMFFPDAKSARQNFFSADGKKPWSTEYTGTGLIESLLDRTPTGQGFRFNTSVIVRSLLESQKHWVSDFDFGFPAKREFEIEFTNKHLVVSGDGDCDVKSPWLDVSLEIKNAEHSAKLKYKEVFKTADIANRDIQTNAFRSLQDGIRKCVVGRYVEVRDPKSRETKSLQTKLASKKPLAERSRKRIVSAKKPAVPKVPAATSTQGGMTIALKRTGKVVPTAKVQPRTMRKVDDFMAKRRAASVDDIFESSVSPEKGDAIFEPASK